MSSDAVNFFMRWAMYVQRPPGRGARLVSPTARVQSGIGLTAATSGLEQMRGKGGRLGRVYRSRAGSRVWETLLTAMLLLGWFALTGAAHSASTVVRVTSFDYDTITGLLKKTVIEPGDSDLCLVTDIASDAYGRPQVTTTRNCNGSPASITGSPMEATAPTGLAAFAPRTVTETYSNDQRFLVTTENALLQTESRGYDARFGALTSLRSPNQLSTTWDYDGLGRKTLETRPDGTKTRWDYVFCSNPSDPAWPAAPAGATAGACPSVPAYFERDGNSIGPSAITPVYYVQATPLRADGVTPNGVYTRVYYDTLGREIRSETQGFDGGATGATVYKDTGYGLDGKVAVKTLPYSAGTSPVYVVSYSYDELGRITRVYEPNAAGGPASTRTVYSGLLTTVRDSKGHETRLLKNASGQVARITDAKSGILDYVYDPLGNMVRSTDAMGNVISMTYDKRGRKTAMYDPDMGVWAYCYDAVGQLKAQQDPNLRGTNLLLPCPTVRDVGTSATSVAGWVTVAYDRLGRTTARTEPDLTSTWTYDSCNLGVGKLCIAAADNGFSRTHSYDALGRLSSTTTWRNSKAYTATVGYDAETGRIRSETYPSGLAIHRTETPLGFPWRVIDARNNTALWTAKKLDPSGNYREVEYGNGLVTTNDYFDDGRLKTTQTGVGGAVQSLVYGYDLNRNVEVRMDLGAGVSTSYVHDELNRLTRETRSGGVLSATQTIDWGYDALGNLSHRTEGGERNSYNYNASGLGSLRPHAVGSVSGQVNAALAPTYQYDANGNMTSGGGRIVNWTSFNMAKSVSMGSVRLEYKYGPDRERFEEVYLSNGASRRTTVYLNSAAGSGLFYEEESGPLGTKIKHFITAGGSTVAVIVCTAEPCTSVGNTSYQYWHKDNLGSVTAVTSQTQSSVPQERLAYEAFGKRRNSNGTGDGNGTLTPSTTDRGFTEHEHMDEVALINMNGRLYDPALSRFVSADPYLQAPRNLQSYNRYSYTSNAPLSRIDPSGFVSESPEYTRQPRQAGAYISWNPTTGKFNYNITFESIKFEWGRESGGDRFSVLSGSVEASGSGVSVTDPASAFRSASAESSYFSPGVVLDEDEGAFLRKVALFSWDEIVKLAEQGSEAHKLLQGHLREDGIVGEQRCLKAPDFCVKPRGRFDLGDPRTLEIWEIKRNSRAGHAAGQAILDIYTAPETGLRRGNDLPGLRVGQTISLTKGNADYEFTNYGLGLIGYSRFEHEDFGGGRRIYIPWWMPGRPRNRDDDGFAY